MVVVIWSLLEEILQQMSIPNAECHWLDWLDSLHIFGHRQLASVTVGRVKEWTDHSLIRTDWNVRMCPTTSEAVCIGCALMWFEHYRNQWRHVVTVLSPDWIVQSLRTTNQGFDSNVINYYTIVWNLSIWSLLNA